MADIKQRLALAIIDFLNTAVKDGSLPQEEKDNMEVAVNCIAESFGVDQSDKVAMDSAVGRQSLLQVYTLYDQLKGVASTSAPSSSATDKESSAPAITDAQKAEAESLKSQGNKSMAAKDYPTAIQHYTNALKIIPGNPIFLSNRAAAYSASKDHESAKADAEAAVATDPTYTKAWSRLGLARFALGDARGSMEAYGKGISFEGNGGSDAMKKGYETAKKRVAEMDDDEANEDGADTLARGAGANGAGAGAGGMPDLSALAGMFGGGGGGAGGAGGMPDFSAIMNNPMFASMAQNLMSNPEALNGIMNNPRVRELANQFGGGAGGAGGAGGGMPDLSAMMNDPSIAEMARNFMGGAGGAGAGAGRGNGASQ